MTCDRGCKSYHAGCDWPDCADSVAIPGGSNPDDDIDFSWRRFTVVPSVQPATEPAKDAEAGTAYGLSGEHDASTREVHDG